MNTAYAKEIETTFAKEGSYGNDRFKQTVKAIRTFMEAGLRVVFLLGSVTMLISFLLILTIPEVSMDEEVKDKQAPLTKSLPEAAD